MLSNHLILCHPLLPYLQSFPALGSFQMNQLFSSGGQSIGVSASASVLPMNIQDGFPLGWTSWISLQSKGLSRVFSVRMAAIQNSTMLERVWRKGNLILLVGMQTSTAAMENSVEIPYKAGNGTAIWPSNPTPGHTHQTSLCRKRSVYSKVWVLLSRFVIAFLPRSKRLLISWLQLSSIVILKSKKIKSTTISIFSPSIWHEVMGPYAMVLVFLNVEF